MANPKRTWTKSARLNEVPRLLTDNPRSIQALCHRMNLEHNKANHRAILRDFDDLRAQGYGIEPDDQAIPEYRITSKPAPKMNPDEALAAHIALRLLYHHTSNPPRSYRNALEKIALTLPPDMQDVAAHSILTNQPGDQRLTEFEKIATCWNQHRRIAFDYLALTSRSGGTHRVELETYFVEISRTNFEIYVIGRRVNHPPFEVRTFLLALMKRVTPLSGVYVIPEDFDPQRYLSNAWGVIGDQHPVIVRLKFDASVRRWLEHRKLPGVIGRDNDEHNNLILTIKTGTNNDGKPVELMSWVRGWGANVEVLEPAVLRAQWLADARAVLERHGGG